MLTLFSRFTDKAKVDRLKRDNLVRHAKDKKHREKRRRICDYIVKVGQSIEKKEEKLHDKHGELLELRQKHINDLTLYIFEISEVRQKRYYKNLTIKVPIMTAAENKHFDIFLQFRWYP